MPRRIGAGGPFLVKPLDGQTVFALAAAEYQFGTHQLAVHQSQCFSFIWKAAAAAVATTNVAFPPLVTNARAPQEQTQLQSQIFSPQTGRQGAVPPLIQGAPQLFDFTLQADFFTPVPMAQGRVPPLLKGSQDDPTQIAARVFPSAVAAPIVANPIAGFFAIPPQNEDRPTAIIWSSQRSGQTPPVFKLAQGSPQLLDLTQQGSIFGPAIGPSLPFKSINAAPQLADFTQQGVIFVPGQPATLITGTTVWPIPPVPPQPDLNVNASFVWTQSPLTVAGTPPVPPDVISGGDGGGGSLGGKWEERSTALRTVRKKRRLEEVPDEIVIYTYPPSIEPIRVGPVDISQLAESLITAPSANWANDLISDQRLRQSIGEDSKRLAALEQEEHEAIAALLIMLDEDET